MGEWTLKIDVPNLGNIWHPLIYWNSSSGIVECFPSIEVIKVINFSVICCGSGKTYALHAQELWPVMQENRLNH